MSRFRTSRCKRCKQEFRLAFNKTCFSDPNCSACEFVISKSVKPGDQERAIDSIKEQLKPFNDMAKKDYKRSK